MSNENQNPLSDYEDCELVNELKRRGYEVYRWPDEDDWPDWLCQSLFTSEGKQETATFGYRSQGADIPKRFISTSYKPQIFRLRFFDGFFKT